MNTMKLSAVAAAAVSLMGLTGAVRAADYATVVSATPVTAAYAVPRTECFNVERVVQPQPSGAGALVGAVVGGLIGNQFGGGAGRFAATGLGAVAGSAIGNQAELNNSPPVAVASQDCRTVSQMQTRVVAYDVVYDYNGQRYSTRTASDPGPRLAIDVRPADAGPPATYGAVPPAYVQGGPPGYASAPPAYYDAPPPAYYAPGPVYGAPSYVAPAVIGLGVGYLVGRNWNNGYQGGYYGGYYGGYRRWH